MSFTRCDPGLILAIESTNPPGSVALGKEGKILSFMKAGEDDQLSGVFLSLVDSALRSAGKSPFDVNALALGTGPGSFTGIRVGFAFARGIAEAMGARILPIPTLDAMAFGGPGGFKFLLPTLDARKGEVYTALYGREGKGCVRESDYISISPENLVYKMVSSECIVYGPGYVRYREEFNRMGVGPYAGEEGTKASPDAGMILDYLFSPGALEGISPGEAEPLYVRPSEAEIKSGRRRS